VRLHKINRDRLNIECGKSVEKLSHSCRVMIVADTQFMPEFAEIPLSRAADLFRG
jgi:hypothetical protein